MDDREELIALRRMAELEARAAPANPDSNLGGTLQFGPLDTGIKIPPALEAGLVGAGRTFDRQIAGIKQYFGNSPELRAQQEENTRLYEPIAKAHPITTFAGEVAPTLAAANPWAMAALGANEYGTAGERAIRGGLGYAGGKIGEGVARLAGPESMRAAPTLASEFFDTTGNKWGIPLTMGQASQSKPLQIAESVVSNLPFGGAVNRARDASFQGFNRALSNTFGEDVTKITPEVTGAALERSGKQIGNIMERANVQLTPDLAQRLSQLSSEVADLGADGAVLSTKIGQFIDKTTNGNGLGGQALRKFDSSVGRIMGGSQVGDVRYAAGSLQEIVRDAASQSLTEAENAALKTARSQNFNVRQVADAIKNNPSGDAVSPAAMLQAVNRYQRNARFGGGNDLAELAQWAKGVLPDKIPNSGTAQRLFYQQLLTNPVSALGGLVGAGYGADKLGIDPKYAALGLLPFGAARFMAGKPASDLTRKMLTSVGGAGLLGSY